MCVGQVAGSALTAAAVALHNRPEDCWVIVGGQVYDVTAWVPRHPGGPLIYVNAGQDCSALFEAYHPLAARQVLHRYHLGPLQQGVTRSASASPSAASLDCDGTQQASPDPFYATLKQRAEQYFRTHKLDPRCSASLYVKAALILAATLLLHQATFFWSTSFPAAMLCAVALAQAMVMVGVCIQHDANHGAFSRVPFINRCAGLTLDLVGGASSWAWNQKHVAGHHVHTNCAGLDPDTAPPPPGAWRLAHGQRWWPAHRLQHLYLPALYTLLSVNTLLAGDFCVLASGRLGARRVTPPTRADLAAFWGGKAAWAAWFVAWPAAAGRWGWAGTLGLLGLTYLVLGGTLALLFQVAHVTGEVEHTQPGGGRRSWAAQQAASSADFAHGSWFWMHYTGGLNYQVVHHLFPGVCHTHYPALAPIVQRTCAEHGVPYVVYPTFWSALGAHFRHLRHMGAGK